MVLHSLVQHDDIAHIPQDFLQVAIIIVDDELLDDPLLILQILAYDISPVPIHTIR
jgi:hypothetical protein